MTPYHCLEDEKIGGTYIQQSLGTNEIPQPEHSTWSEMTIVLKIQVILGSLRNSFLL